MQQKTYKHYLGLDISKHKLDIATSTGKVVIVENNEASIRSLIDQCREELTEGVCVMEASRGYENN